MDQSSYSYLWPNAIPEDRTGTSVKFVRWISQYDEKMENYSSYVRGKIRLNLRDLPNFAKINRFKKLIYFGIY